METRQYVGRVLIAVALATLALAAWQVVEVLLLGFAAALLAVALRAMADQLRSWLPLSAGWSLAVAVILTLAALAGGLWVFGRDISAQIEQLAELLPSAWERWVGTVRQYAWGRALVAELSETDISAISPDIVADAGSLLMGLFGGLGGVLLVVAGGVYLAAQPALYRDGIVALVPREAEARAREALDAAAQGLRQWLKGQLIAMVLVGIVTGVGLWLIGVPSALALGLFAGALEFVPLIGPVAAAIPALLVASTQGAVTVLYTLALFIAIQQVESNLITPLVERRLAHVPPALTLFAVVALGTLFGMLGVLLAAPLTVVGYVVARRVYVHRALGKRPR